MKKILPILLILAALGAAGYALYRNQEMTAEPPAGIAEANGRLELKRYDVATLRPGKIAAVNIEEGQSVESDAVLVEIGSEEVDAKLAVAQAAKVRAEGAVIRAESARTRAESAEARAAGSVIQAQAQINAQNAQLAIAENDLQNARAMRKQKLVSTTEVTQREKARDAHRAGVTAAQAAKTQAQAGTEEAKAAIAEAGAGIAEAKAAVAQAQAEMNAIAVYKRDLLVRAPITGRVEYVVAQVGNVVAAGTTVATLVDPNDVSMSVFLPTGETGKVPLGAEARIIIDGLDAVFPAKVTFIADQAQFTPKFVETRSERENMMYRVKVKMDEDTAQQYRHLLKGGLSAVGYVRYDNSVSWPEHLAVKLPPAEH